MHWPTSNHKPRPWHNKSCTHTHMHILRRIHITLDLVTENPLIIDPSATKKYPSATGSIFVGISVPVVGSKVRSRHHSLTIASGLSSRMTVSGTMPRSSMACACVSVRECVNFVILRVWLAIVERMRCESLCVYACIYLCMYDVYDVSDVYDVGDVYDAWLSSGTTHSSGNIYVCMHALSEQRTGHKHKYATHLKSN